MCGICGIIGSTRPPSQRETITRSMMEAMVHRGPDGKGIHITDSFACGHQRLAVIDVEHGQQPMHSPDGRYTLVFNGEIYNYIELRQELVQEGVVFRTSSDTEVLLQMLIHKGEAAIGRLNGMFAFTFYDRDTDSWIMGRDHFGIKPLYYSVLKDEIVFASEIKLLLKHPDVQAEADWESIQQYMTFQFCLGERTLFRNILKLEPGCYLTGSKGKISKTTRYWDTQFVIDGYHTEEYFVNRLRELIEDGIRLQIRSDVPLGAYLSGGIDSSVVASLATNHYGAPLKLFHGAFSEGPEFEETHYARIISRECKSELLTVIPTAQQFVDDMPKLIYAMDEPSAGPGIFPQYKVSQLARQHVKVVLGGQGGDELFAGYIRYFLGYLEQSIKGAIFETQEEGKHIVTLESIIPNLSTLQSYHPLMQQLWKKGLFGEMDLRYFQLIDRSPDIKQLLTKDASSQFNKEFVIAEFQKVFNYPDTKSYINKMTHFDLKTLLPALLQVEDRVSMAVSLESRVPLLDYRVAELVCSMPPKIKFKGGKTKSVFRKAVKGLIPPSVMNRKDKMGFPVPLSQWMSKGPVRDFVFDVLDSRACRERGLFNPKILKQMVENEITFGRQIWGALCLELWHQKFIDAA